MRARCSARQLRQRAAAGGCANTTGFLLPEVATTRQVASAAADGPPYDSNAVRSWCATAWQLVCAIVIAAHAALSSSSSSAPLARRSSLKPSISPWLHNRSSSVCARDTAGLLPCAATAATPTRLRRWQPRVATTLPTLATVPVRHAGAPQRTAACHASARRGACQRRASRPAVAAAASSRRCRGVSVGGETRRPSAQHGQSAWRVGRARTRCAPASSVTRASVQSQAPTRSAPHSDRHTRCPPRASVSARARRVARGVSLAARFCAHGRGV